MMDHDCIVISDDEDEDVHIIRHVVNLVPQFIDLTESEGKSREREKNRNQEQRESTNPTREPDKTSDSSSNSAPSSPTTSSTSSSSSQSSGASSLSSSPPEQSQHSQQPLHQSHQPHQKGQQSTFFPTTTNWAWPHQTTQRPQTNWTQQAPKRTPWSQPPSQTGKATELPKETNPPKEQAQQSRTCEPSQSTESFQPCQVPIVDSTSAPQQPQNEKELMVTLKNSGNQKFTQNLFDDAIRIYKRANELAKKTNNLEISATLHFNLAMAYFKLGSYDQSIDECGSAIKLNQNYIKAHVKRAEIYFKQKKFEEAVICWEHICELDKPNDRFTISLNHAREAAKRFSKKKDHYEVLGLTSPFVTQEELRKLYRVRALKHHPDRHSDADQVTRKIEEKKFKDISEAYSNIQKRLGFNR